MCVCGIIIASITESLHMLESVMLLGSIHISATVLMERKHYDE